MQTFFARCACPVVDDGLNDDTVAFLVVRYVGGDLFDDAAELVPERQRDRFAGDRVGGCWAEVWAAEVLVEVYW